MRRVAVEDRVEVGERGIGGGFAQDLGAQAAGDEIVGFQRQQFPEHLQGLRALALAAAGLGQRAQRRRRARGIERQRVRQRLFGERPHLAAEIRHAERELRGGQVRRRGGRGGEAAQRAVGVALRLQHIALGDLHLRMVFGDALGELQVAAGFLDVAAPDRQMHQQHVCAELVRVELERLVQPADRARRVALAEAQRGEAEVVVGVVRRRGDRLFEGLARAVEVAGSLQADAQQVPGRGVVGFGGGEGAGVGERGGGVAAAQRVGDLGEHGRGFRRKRKPAL